MGLIFNFGESFFFWVGFFLVGEKKNPVPLGFYLKSPFFFFFGKGFLPGFKIFWEPVLSGGVWGTPPNGFCGWVFF